MTVAIDRDGRSAARALQPDAEGYVHRDGVRIFWESFGEGERTILFLPSWSIVYSRIWKGQVPFLARHFRVITFDPRGNGGRTARRTARPMRWTSTSPTRWL